MADFSQLRTQLNQARSQKEQSKHDLFVEKERLGKITREKEALTRIYDESKKEHEARMKQLLINEKNAKNSIAEFSDTLASNTATEATFFKDFAVFTDPREHINSLNDNYPILLLPVRIETRFKKVQIEEKTVDQLWVRIFPDDCAIDTFESVPSENEMENTRFFWSSLWQAGGHEDQERAAWRALVSSHGSGRASWLIKNYVPDNAGEQPTKVNPEDVILVISVTEMPPAADQTAILDFWKAYWLADGNKEAADIAFNKLVASVGAELAERYFKTLAPENINYKPAPPNSKADVNLDAVFLDFPVLESEDTKNQSWSQAPKTKVLPDRFVLIGYNNDKVDFEVVGNAIPSPLIMGPDPSLDKDEQIKQEDGEIKVNEDIEWLINFDEAIAKGMGFKINLNATQASRGFTKIIALGVKISADLDDSTSLLEELIDHHKNSRKGFSILPQGTPTNNTEKEGAGYKSLDDADLSFDNLRKEKLFDLTNDWFRRKDGQWLAESLGISDEVVQNIMYSDGTDQCEARAMNVALWPATMGYMMESLMQPVFSDNDMDATRTFFNHVVLGRGTVPAIKIGKQPYGIYPTTAFSNIQWIQPRRDVGHTNISNTGISIGGFFNYLLKLYNILKTIDGHWYNDHFGKVSYIGKSGGDAHDILLNALGLNPDSIEFHQRNAESREALINRYSFFAPVNILKTALNNTFYFLDPFNLLQGLGYKGDDRPEILEKFFNRKQNLLKGPLIDDVPLTETNPIRNYTPAPDPHNYLRWLINAASTSHDTLRKQDGFLDDKIPTALLYHMLHHALDLNFIDISLKLHLQAELLSSNQIRQAKIEPKFLHVQQNVQQTESKWQYLYKKDNRITENFNGEVGEYIPQILNTKVAAAYLKDQLKALEHLENATTASLERCFVEHIDLVSYRLDAWKNGIMNYQLARMRMPVNEDADGNMEPYHKGTYIGAYGILEDVVSEDKNLTEVRNLDPELEETFLGGDVPLFKDDKNGGYISAPSLNHAVTAAVLRNGYIENATKDDPDLLKVNLSSERVRKALGVIEGIRAGQSLPELLGYQLERGLHDGHPGLELDIYIYQLRKAFPLRANRQKDTKDDDAAIEEIEARNVVDGLALIEHLKTLPDNAVYPYGKSLSTDGLTQPMIDAIAQEVNNIQDINDAVSDLAIAESVHQVVQGNYDRGAATLETYSKGKFPPIPEVIQTPRSGINITHRVGIQLESGVALNVSPTSFSMTPRAKGEPAVNKWLTSVLPAPTDIACKVTYYDHSDDSTKEVVITQEDLKWQALDMIYLLDIDMEQAITQIDDWLIQYVKDNFNPRPDAEIRIKYLEKITGPDKINFFEISPLINSLRSLILSSRPLQTEDVSRPTEEKADIVSSWVLDAHRIVENRTTLDGIKTNADATYTTISGFTDAETPIISQIIANANGWADTVIGIIKSLLPFGNQQASLGSVHDLKAGIFTAVIKFVNTIIERWNNKLTAYTELMATVPGAATDEEKIEIMIQAEKEISTTSTSPIPPNPAAYEAELNIKLTNFQNKLDALNAILTTTTTSVTTLYNDLVAILPLTDFDFEEIDIIPIEEQIVVFAEDLAARMDNISKDLTAKITKVDAYLVAHGAASDSRKQVEALQNAGKVIFGEDFKMFHEFTLPEDQGDEWENTYNAQAQLLDYSINQNNIDFPMDEWLYGLARVREKMHHFENINFMNEAFGGSELSLHPIQLPHKPNDHWLALGYPEDYGQDEEDYIEGQEITKDKLLYSAIYSQPFDKTSNQCGMLVDEWTELIPSKNETAGVTFNFDKPNSEPPQVMLLAMPTDFRGEWQWNDLVQIIHETLEMAKKRAIEPDHIDKDVRGYSRYLPATVSSYTTFPITASLNFSFVNQIYTVLNQDGN